MRQQGRRLDCRLKVALDAKAITLAETQRARLLDISQRGARIAVKEPIRVGALIVLQWLDQEAFGTIVWQDNGVCGIKFDRRISAQQLIELRDTCDAGMQDEVEYENAKAWAPGWTEAGALKNLRV